MSVHGDKIFLLKMQSPLLQTGDEGKNKAGNEIFRPKNDVLFSIAGNKACFCKVNAAKPVAYRQVSARINFNYSNKKEFI